MINAIRYHELTINCNGQDLLILVNGHFKYTNTCVVLQVVKKLFIYIYIYIYIVFCDTTVHSATICNKCIILESVKISYYMNCRICKNNCDYFDNDKHVKSYCHCLYIKKLSNLYQTVPQTP